MKIMRLLKSLSLSILILIVYSLSMNAQNDHFIKTNENQKHDSKTLDTDPPSDSNVQERRNVPFISLIIISDVAAIHADIDPATRWPEIQGRKTNQNIEITKILEIKLFPNPCQSYTNIAYTLAEDSEVNIEVYNIQGEQVACINNNEYQLVGEHRAEIDMSHLANGTYICRVSQSNGEVASQRFVKME